MGIQTVTFARRVQLVRRQMLGTTPAILRTFLFGTWALALVTYLVLLASAGQYRQAIKTVKKDATLSMVAAQQMKAWLCDMHSDAANVLLADSSSPASQEARKAYKERANNLIDPYADATENITEPTERKQIVNFGYSFQPYYTLIERAFVFHEQGKEREAIDAYWRADELVRKQFLPAAVELDQINREVLASRYQHEKDTSATVRFGMALMELLLLGGLAGTQFFLFRRMRRLVSPLLLGASGLVFGLLLYTLIAFDLASAALKTAKEDAFDSRDVLWRARAEAYDANGDESRWLLEPAQREFYQGEFRKKVQDIVQVPREMTYDQLVEAVRKTDPHYKSMPKGFTRQSGLLGVELNNITFEGEGKAAADTLAAFGRYLTIDERIRQLEKDGKHKEAVELCVGNKEGQSNWAFDQFNNALNRTLEINDNEFHKAVGEGDKDGRAQHALAGFEVTSAVLLLVVSVLTYLGLRPRLQEYAL